LLHKIGILIVGCVQGTAVGWHEDASVAGKCNIFRAEQVTGFGCEDVAGGIVAGRGAKGEGNV